MHRGLAMILCGWAMFSSAACVDRTDDEDAEQVSDVTEEVRTFRFTVFPNPYGDGTANPAEKIRGTARGYRTTNPKVVSGLKEWTVTSLDLRSLPPNRAFGAHAHALKCDDTQGGGHYQHVAGQINPVTSEIWLDFTTDANGRAEVEILSPFAVRPGGVQSIVIHTQATDAATGKAGAKLVCANLAIN